MYPSIWVIERQAVQDDRIGEFDLNRSSFVLILPYTLHRHADFWPDPERLDPLRFTGDTLRLRDGYLPYGLDQHRCIGLHLATALAVRIIDTVLAQFRLHLLPRQVAATIAGITLRHKTPVQIQTEAR